MSRLPCPFGLLPLMPRLPTLPTFAGPPLLESCRPTSTAAAGREGESAPPTGAKAPTNTLPSPIPHPAQPPGPLSPLSVAYTLSSTSLQTLKIKNPFAYANSFI